jgi:hypothetical protein
LSSFVRLASLYRSHAHAPVFVVFVFRTWQVFVVVLSLFAFWYFTTVILLLRNFEAMKQTWALNLIGTSPSLFLFLIS